MFYEGSEKKAEIIIDSRQFSLLREFSDDFWAQMVECCDAYILSSISNEHCKAFLLSESSLFVWDDRVIILTCGQTRLVLAVEFLLNAIDNALVLQTIYQRKNEHLAYAQHSTFLDDAKLLEQHFKGKALLFGDTHGHHQYVHHMDNAFKADKTDKSYELLVYKINDTVSKTLMNGGLSCEEIRQLLRLDELLPGFAVDDYIFEPFGYSLNAIKDDRYFTIHVTPQTISSYVSFESNVNLIDVLPIILEVLSPQAFDLVCYNEFDFQQQAAERVPQSFICKKAVEGTLSIGYLVNFASYLRPHVKTTKPIALNIAGDDNELRFMD